MTTRKVLDGAHVADVEVTLRGDDKILDLPAARVGSIVFSRWELSDEDRAAIAAGGDLLVAMLVGNAQPQPMTVFAMSPEPPLQVGHLKGLVQELCS